MNWLADLHIHSPYSRATSQKSDLFGLAAWAMAKGLALVGTGDFTHPAWLAHLEKELAPAEEGLFRLRQPPTPLPGLTVQGGSPRFILTAEVSSIYKKAGKTRKIHNLLFVPSFAEAKAVNRRLATIGNIASDGRPILGLDARNLLEILLEESPTGFLVPAHIWTPWFSLFGSKSGFDRLEDCFEDLSSHVFALETGLSSDPAMIRRISSLDRYSLISNSDCHSPSKLGREANCFSCGISFPALKAALQDPALGFQGTLEFYPDEGKYHLDGHRNCNVVFTPEQTAQAKGICPVCGKGVTVGVLNRVQELADRVEPLYRAQDQFQSLIPLEEILAELIGQGMTAKAVQGLYFHLLARQGAEFTLLRHWPLEEAEQVSPLLAEALRRLRAGQVHRQGGFDGEFGRITLFTPLELAAEAAEQKRLRQRFR